MKTPRPRLSPCSTPYSCLFRVIIENPNSKPYSKFFRGRKIRFLENKSVRNGLR